MACDELFDTNDFRLLAGLPDQAAWRSKAVARVYDAGQALFHEGEQPEMLIMLVEGQVRVWRCSPDGSTTTAHVLGTGDVPGLIAILTSRTYPATATALTPVRALTWAASWVPELVRCNPKLLVNALCILGQRNEDLLQRLQEASGYPVEQRVARAIVRLAQGTRQPPGKPVDLPVRRRDVADIAGTTLHSVSRLVSRWERDGILLSGRSRITLLDMDRLTAVAAWS